MNLKRIIQNTSERTVRIIASKVRVPFAVSDEHACAIRAAKTNAERPTPNIERRTFPFPSTRVWRAPAINHPSYA